MIKGAGQFDIDELVNHEWRHYFSPQEIQDRKDLSLKMNDEIDRLKIEMKAATDKFRAEIKEKALEEKMARLEVKTGHIDKFEKVKVIMNYAVERVEFWNQDGDMVDERPMSKKELRQGAYVNN